MANTYWCAAGQPGVGGADAPVLVGLAAVGSAAVIPGVVDGSGDWPSGCWHRQQQERKAKEFVHLRLVPTW